MSTSTLPRRRHPLTGRPIVPVGYRKNGRPIMPILGGSEPPNQPTPAPAPPAPSPTPPAAPEKPDGVTDAEWAALGDPGKSALVRERQRAQAAETALAAARAGQPQPPKPAPPKPADPPPKGPDGQPDIAAMIQQAVQAAVNPLLERDATREAVEAAEKVQGRGHDGRGGPFPRCDRRPRAGRPHHADRRRGPPGSAEDHHGPRRLADAQAAPGQGHRLPAARAARAPRSAPPASVPGLLSTSASRRPWRGCSRPRA
jgi:hypothetical protein